MMYPSWNKRACVLFFILFTAGTLFSLYVHGGFAMSKDPVITEPHADKPAIDERMPLKFETATFSLG